MSPVYCTAEYSGLMNLSRENERLRKVREENRCEEGDCLLVPNDLGQLATRDEVSTWSFRLRVGLFFMNTGQPAPQEIPVACNPGKTKTSRRWN